jgi:electron transport complex protein RnfG
MTNETENTFGMSKAIRSSAIGLAIFAFFTVGIISLTQITTEPSITQNQKEYEARILLSLLPSTVEADDLLDSKQIFSDLTLEGFALINVESNEGFYQVITETNQVDAIILPVVAPEGYTESIRLIVGISPVGQVIGVRVTKHKETPGLGDQIETTKSDWIYSFNDRSLTNPEDSNWLVKKDGGDFDQMTGATITPRAIVKAVKQSLEFFDLNRSVLLSTDTQEN